MHFLFGLLFTVESGIPGSKQADWRIFWWWKASRIGSFIFFLLVLLLVRPPLFLPLLLRYHNYNILIPLVFLFRVLLLSSRWARACVKTGRGSGFQCTVLPSLYVLMDNRGGG